MTPAMVRRAGHVRAFAAFVASGAVAVVLLPTLVTPIAWLISRAIVGFVLAGVYTIVEFVDQRRRDQRQSRRALFGLPARQLGRDRARPALYARVGSEGLSCRSPSVRRSLAIAIVPLMMTNAEAPETPRVGADQLVERQAAFDDLGARRARRRPLQRRRRFRWPRSMRCKSASSPSRCRISPPR